MAKNIFIVLVSLMAYGCGSGDAIDAVENAANNLSGAIDDISNTVDELANMQPSDDDNESGEATVVTPQVTTRPEFVEDYQYACSTFPDRDNVWVWSFRPDLDIADQYDFVTGAWEWIDNTQLLIRPTGNPEVVGMINDNGGTIFLENWGDCVLRYGRPLTEQFTRPN